MPETPEPLESTLRAVYSRIAPQIKIDGLYVRVNIAANDFGFGYVTGIEIQSKDGYQHVELCLENDYEDEREDINNYMWVYRDLHSGWGIESELSYNSPDEEVAEFFKSTHLKNMEAFANNMEVSIENIRASNK